MEIYHSNVQRHCSLTDIRAWHLGESEELEKWIGVGYYNTFFLCENKLTQLYYHARECDIVFKILKQKLAGDLFDNLCDDFFNLIEKSKMTFSYDELFKLSVKCWPALSIFDEISKHPEIASEDIVRRLIRVRQTTETFSYELSKRLNHIPSPEKYIFFKGNIILKPLNHFTKINNISIENEC